MCVGIVPQDQGKLDEAEPLFLRCLAINQKAYGADHPEVATDCGNLAMLYQVRAPRGEGTITRRCDFMRGEVVGWLLSVPGERARSRCARLRRASFPSSHDVVVVARAT